MSERIKKRTLGNINDLTLEEARKLAIENMRKADRDREIINSNDPDQYEDEMAAIENYWKDEAFNIKGRLAIYYDYHTGSWVSHFMDHHGQIIAGTTTIDGEGQFDIADSLLELRKNYEIHK